MSLTCAYVQVFLSLQRQWLQLQRLRSKVPHMDCEYRHYGTMQVCDLYVYEDCEFCNDLGTHQDCEYFRPHNVLPTKTASVDKDTSNLIYMI